MECCFSQTLLLRKPIQLPSDPVSDEECEVSVQSDKKKLHIFFISFFLFLFLCLIWMKFWTAKFHPLHCLLFIVSFINSFNSFSANGNGNRCYEKKKNLTVATFCQPYNDRCSTCSRIRKTCTWFL